MTFPEALFCTVCVLSSAAVVITLIITSTRR